MRIIKLKDQGAFIGYDDVRSVYLFAFCDQSGQQNFECIMTGKLIDNDGRVYHLLRNGVIESDHKRISCDWLVSHLLLETNNNDVFRFGYEFANDHDFKGSDIDSIKSFYVNEMAGA